MKSLLEARRLQVAFGNGRSRLKAVDQVDLQLFAGTTLGLVGESGSGKSTLGRALAGLVRVASGSVFFAGKDVTNPKGRELSNLRSAVQIVFQDPSSSLNPRLQVGSAVEEVIAAHPNGRSISHRARALELLGLVDLDGKIANRYPHQLSGGQRQRVAIARALAVGAKVLILDEVTSSLDVSVQANVLNLLRRLQSDLGLTFLFISHNLSVVRYMSDSIAVMYLGRILEHGYATSVWDNPRHPYTLALIESLPILGRQLVVGALGEAPNPLSPPSGCRYHPRCAVGPLVNTERSICVERDPSFEIDGTPAAVACHFADKHERAQLA
jgi:peptide/nickel transport system ATP-binding protein